VSFRTNEAYLITQEIRNSKLEEPDRDRIKQNIKDVVTALFGTPDEPQFPSFDELDTSSLINLSKLEMAAGSVSSDKFGAPRGLYREHCGHCHGISGDGQGPTAAFLNPYPRDYRKGVFKFKSTPSTTPPTHDDLHRVLFNGIAGTAMPSFKLLPSDELEALLQYVRYLSIRGEVERSLIDAAVADSVLMIDLADQKGAAEQSSNVRAIAEDVVSKWLACEEQATPVPPPPENFESPESIARGRELFYGPIAQCTKCHGETGLGDGVTTDYDEWTKELMPTEPEKLSEFLAIGAALDPRPIRPRNLRLNVFRGGRRPVDIFWRIHNGIAGTPMPAASLRPEGAGDDDPRLTHDDIWHLIAYVRHLPYESLSEPPHQVAYQRERQ
jgi:mono/diheme cytochrome c family protein